MVSLIQPPDPQTLLPPILACLPTAFASPRPPPALIPLLSPILRQRLSFLTSSNSDNWLKLLCWDSSASQSLWDQIENATFEPHPSSGEIEVGDVTSIQYKRFDEETLKAQLVLADWPFTPIFLWCTGTEDDGWKLSELLPSPSVESSWCDSVHEANETSKERIMKEALQEADSSQPQQRSSSHLSIPKEEDDYWAQYDQSPGRTPVRKPSVPVTQQTEEDYYAQYTAVQPAMDNHDPDEEMSLPQQNGNTNPDQHRNGHPQSYQHPLSQHIEPPPYPDPSPDDDLEDQRETEVIQPHPSSPSSRGSDTIARLEDAAERYETSETGTQQSQSSSDFAVRQHISTSMKSMYRLAKSVGMSRREYEELIAREVEGSRFLDLDD